MAKALRKFTTKNQADKTFGIYDEKGDFYIGDKKVEINGNDFEVKDNVTGVVDKTYIDTPGLSELIVSPKPKDYTKEDYDNYTKLMVKTGALRQKENPNLKAVNQINGSINLKIFGIIGKSMRERGLLLFRAILTRC